MPCSVMGRADNQLEVSFSEKIFVVKGIRRGGSGINGTCPSIKQWLVWLRGDAAVERH